MWIYIHCVKEDRSLTKTQTKQWDMQWRGGGEVNLGSSRLGKSSSQTVEHSAMKGPGVQENKLSF